MSSWCQIFSWDVEVEQPANRDEAQQLTQRLQKLVDAEDPSVHEYSVDWIGNAWGNSKVLGRNIEEAELLLNFGLDYGFDSGNTDDWETRGLRCEETGEEADW